MILQEPIRDALKELPDPHPDAGEFGVLRVVASYPFSVKLTEAKVNGDKMVSGGMPDYWDTRKHGPLAIMNMDLLERLTGDVSPTQCLQRWRSKQPWQSTADSGRGKRKDREEDPAEGSRGAKQPKLAEGGKGVAADKPKKEGRGDKGKRGKGKGWG
ncbi:uncharacterized protein SCHCODRAFT_02499382 [Schizophyllum commune H4-8]|nr:uncharacterized protein SCHCODRAFT_02499382 [Schizophyllum commune H4-8]KAI5894150.1 hypothetical protein SCHCODRAFT_02499382 [Schizophyllum commune H4-8]